MVRLKTVSFLLSSIILLTVSNPIMTSEGIFEIHIKSYVLRKSLELEKCCSKPNLLSRNCASECKIFMEICLSIYQKVPHRYACDIGENMIVTDILGNDQMSASSTKDYSIKVRERWIKNFNILVKIKHKNEQTKKEEIIVTLSSAEENVKPSTDWITKQLSTPKDQFQLFVSFRYFCSEYHYGEMCDKYCKPTDSNIGHYNCSSAGDIICHNGYVGSYCDKVVCRKKCVHGTCTGPNLCRCFTGWTGNSCDKCIPYPGCVNGGCRRDEKTKDLLPLTCDCKNVWGGMFCNIDLNYCSNNPNVCLNGGECQNFGNINTNQQYRCFCKPGYRGTHCEKSETNCLVRGCLNEGICETNTQRNVSICSCKKSFYGDQCQFNMTSCAENPCIGSNSKCYQDKKLGFKCECATGFIGRNCEIDKDECSTNPCLNGGMCIDRASGFRCVCPVGFSGNRCQVNKNDCQKLSCMNGAKCMDRANRIDCECTAGWTGPICNQNIDECAINQPCMHGGKCEDTPGSYKCTCLPFWSGDHCQMKVMVNDSKVIDKKCLINPCRNHGTCFLIPKREHNYVNTNMVKSIGGPYYCICPPGFTGTFCNKVMIANGSLIDSNQFAISTETIISFTEKYRKTSMTLINLIIIAIGVPAILLILIIISFLWCKTSKSLEKSQSTKYQNSIMKNHNFVNKSNIKILNNKLNSSNHSIFCSNKISLSGGTKQMQSLNNMPLPHLSMATYKCSMMPLVVDKHSQLNQQSVVSKNPNLYSTEISEEEDRFIDKSFQSIVDRDGEPESIVYQNVSPLKDLSKSNLKSSLDSNINNQDQKEYKSWIGSNSVMLNRKKERHNLKGLSSSQNSLLESPINKNLRTAVSQQFHQASSQCYEDNFCDKVEPKFFRKVKPMSNHNCTVELAWPLVNCKISSENTPNTDNKLPYTENRYVLYYTHSVLHPKINYNLISHPNFKETSCFRDSSVIYPSLRSVRTDSTSIDGNTSPNM